jgi:hypothetical protein
MADPGDRDPAQVSATVKRLFILSEELFRRSAALREEDAAMHDVISALLERSAQLAVWSPRHRRW